jgi:CBS domain-containing protein
MPDAKDIMTKEVITVQEDTTIHEMAQIFVQNKISGVPVVDAQGRLTGIVTENDLINKNKKLHIPTVLRLFDAYIPLGTSKLETDIKRMAAITAGDILTKEVVTVNEDARVEDIATIMSEKNIHLLPVLRDGTLVGIIGKRDLIRAVAREGTE